MMEIDPLHLSEEELNFELALRHITGLGLTTRRNKCIKLRDAMAEDATLGRSYPTSDHVMDDVTNIEFCQSRIKHLLPSLEMAKKKKDVGFLVNTVSRLTHYSNRLSRIENPPAHLREGWATLKELISSTLEEVLDVLNPNSVNSAGSANNNQVQTTVPVSNVNTGAISKSTSRGDPPTSQQSQEPLEKTHQETPKRNGRGIGEGTHNSVRRSLIDLLGEADAPETPVGETGRKEEGLKHGFGGAPIASSSAAQTGGRGRGVTVNLGMGSRQAAAAWCDQQTLWNENNNQGFPPPPYRATEASHDMESSREYNRLRDELLNILLRQERARSEGARNPKAIHNWPFKFRGEKDTTTLNTFLDRVECFAQSEGVSDDVLLRSIKHLLQDDALDWYGRAFNERTLLTWDDFKNQIRREFLPSSYAQMLRVEACFRFQGATESFAKFYRDISALFRFVTPPMSEEERFFIVKKNMNTEYASIVAAARPRSLQEMVEVCNGFDETRMLLSRQRRLPMPQSALLEPNYATPSTTHKHAQHSAPMRFGRVHALESDLGQEVDQDRLGCLQPEEDSYAHQLENLIQQVSALKARLDRKEQFRRPVSQSPRPEAGAAGTQAQQSNQQKYQHQRVQLQTAIERSIEDEQRPPMVCWNCDEDGHRFTDCGKPQAMFFCYRCGQKGYSLRNCPTCAPNQGNGQAGNYQ